jgi:chromosome segregation ATPase
VVAESMFVMKSMNEKRVCDKNEVSRLNEEIAKVKAENNSLKNNLFEAQKNVDVNKKGKDVKSLTVQTEDKGDALVKENHQLKMQLKQNAETFDKISEKLAAAERNTKLLQEKDKEIESMKKDKKELVEAVELLVESAQKIMESSRGSEKVASLDMILGKNSINLFKN